MKYKLLGVFIFWMMLFVNQSCLKEDVVPEGCNKIQYDLELYVNGPEDKGTQIISHENQPDGCIALVVQYGGGCEIHELGLVVGSWSYTDPITAEARILHENVDPCDALIADTLYFDTESLFINGYEKLRLAIKDYNEMIVLENTD